MCITGRYYQQTTPRWFRPGWLLRSLGLFDWESGCPRPDPPLAGGLAHHRCSGDPCHDLLGETVQFTGRERQGVVVIPRTAVPVSILTHHEHGAVDGLACDNAGPQVQFRIALQQGFLVAPHGHAGEARGQDDLHEVTVQFPVHLVQIHAVLVAVPDLHGAGGGGDGGGEFHGGDVHGGIVLGVGGVVKGKVHISPQPAEASQSLSASQSSWDMWHTASVNARRSASEAKSSGSGTVGLVVFMGSF